MTDTIHLEAFSENVRKQKIYCVGDIQSLDKMLFGLYVSYNEEIIHRTKTVLILSDNYVKHTPKFSKNMYFDVIYRIKEAKDLQLAYTYIQHCTKPLLVVWYTNDLPQVIFNALNNSKDDITLIAGGMQYPKQSYSSVFWSTKSTFEDVNPFISLRTKELDVRTILNETKASDVSLVWCSNGTSDKKGLLYWFDFNTTKNVLPSINYVQASEYLRTLADALEVKDQ